MATYGRFATGADLGSFGLGATDATAALKVGGGAASGAATKALGKAGGPGMMLAMKGLGAAWAGFQARKKNKALAGAQASLYNVWQENVAAAQEERELRDEGITSKFEVAGEDLDLETGGSRKAVTQQFTDVARKRGFASTGAELEGFNVIEKLMASYDRSKDRLVAGEDLALRESEQQFEGQRRRMGQQLAAQHGKLESQKQSFGEAALGSLVG